jgi:hypothetical protein
MISELHAPMVALAHVGINSGETLFACDFETARKGNIIEESSRFILKYSSPSNRLFLNPSQIQLTSFFKTVE